MTESDKDIGLVNENKLLEELCLRQIDHMQNLDQIDQRMIALAKTGLQQAFMWMNRAVFQPERIKLAKGDVNALMQHLTAR